MVGTWKHAPIMGVLPWRVFSNMNANCTWRNLHHLHIGKSLSLDRTSNHMVIGISQWPTIPIHVDNKMWHYYCHDIIENETHLVLEFLLYNPVERRFIFLFQTIMSRSLESFYQLDHHVGISHYITLTIAFHFSRELAFSKPPSVLLIHKPFGCVDFKIKFTSKQNICIMIAIHRKKKCAIHSWWHHSPIPTSQWRCFLRMCFCWEA